MSMERTKSYELMQKAMNSNSRSRLMVWCQWWCVISDRVDQNV